MNDKHPGTPLDQVLRLITGFDPLQDGDVAKTNSFTFQIDTDGESHLYTIPSARDRLDMKNTIIKAIHPNQSLINDCKGWVLISDDIVQKGEIDEQEFDVTIVASYMLTISAKDEGAVRKKVRDDPDIKAAIWRGLRRSGLDITDIQQSE